MVELGREMPVKRLTSVRRSCGVDIRFRPHFGVEARLIRDGRVDDVISKFLTSWVIGGVIQQIKGEAISNCLWPEKAESKEPFQPQPDL